VVVPDDELLLVPPGLLSPQRDNSLLVTHKHGPGLGQLGARAVRQTLADLVDVLLAVAGGVAALAGGRDDARQSSLTSRE